MIGIGQKSGLGIGGESDDAAPAGDLTPMLDVLFILLIFFVLTANSVQLTLDVALPRQDPEGAAQVKPEAKVVIAIPAAANSWTIDKKTYEDWDETEVAIRKKFADDPKTKFIVAPDRAVNVERLVRVLSLLQRLGIKNTELLMEPK